MILALDGTAIIVSIVSTFGVIIVGVFGYLGVTSQVKRSATEVTDKVVDLDNVNTYQHGENAKLLHRMLDTISEHGILVSAVVDVQDRPIIKTDASGALIQVNAAGVKLLGMTPQELSGNGWVKAVHPDDRVKVFGEWQEAVKNKTPFGPLSYRYLHPTTKVETLVEAVATPVISGLDGELLSWIAVVVPIIDVTHNEES